MKWHVVVVLLPQSLADAVKRENVFISPCKIYLFLFTSIFHSCISPGKEHVSSKQTKYPTSGWLQIHYRSVQMLSLWNTRVWMWLKLSVFWIPAPLHLGGNAVPFNWPAWFSAFWFLFVSFLPPISSALWPFSSMKFLQSSLIYLTSMSVEQSEKLKAMFLTLIILLLHKSYHKELHVSAAVYLIDSFKEKINSAHKVQFADFVADGEQPICRAQTELHAGKEKKKKRNAKCHFLVEEVSCNTDIIVTQERLIFYNSLKDTYLINLRAVCGLLSSYSFFFFLAQILLNTQRVKCFSWFYSTEASWRALA